MLDLSNASKMQKGDEPVGALTKEQKYHQRILKYLKRKKEAKANKSKTRQTHGLHNDEPCKLDARGVPIIDPLFIKPSKKTTEEVDPTSINQPFFVIKGANGTKMIYREDSIKNLMNNSIVRYDDPAVLEKAKKQMGMTIKF